MLMKKAAGVIGRMLFGIKEIEGTKWLYLCRISP
jgi:hypothetical protein